MGYSLVIGNVTVSAEELSEKVALGALSRFQAEAETNPDATLELTRGAVTAAEVFAAPRDLVPEFAPLGVGQPMSIEILTVYTGDAPKRGVFGGQPDLLVTSAVKGIETFDAAPRAINQIVKNIDDKQYIVPSALTEGSPIVYYTPAVVNSTTFCSFELITEAFSDRTFQQISTLFTSAAGLPVFAPAKAYLIAGSFFTTIIGDLAEALLKNTPFLRSDLPLRFDTPEVPPALARQAILFNDRDAAELAPYRTGLVSAGPDRERVALQHEETGAEYRGAAPYVIVSLDGRRRDELEAFTPKIASAALLERFYGGEDTGGQVIGALETAMQLYNDFMYHQKAQRLKEQLEALDPESETYEEDRKRLEKLFAAYAGNIRQELFKV